MSVSESFKYYSHKFSEKVDNEIKFTNDMIAELKKEIESDNSKFELYGDLLITLSKLEKLKDGLDDLMTEEE